MTFDEDRDDDGLDALDRALVAGMEESCPIYATVVTDTPAQDQETVAELPEITVIVSRI